MYAAIFVLGMATPSRLNVQFVYMIEFVDERYRSLIGVIYSVYGAVIYMFVPFYFQFISKDWIYLTYIGVLLNCISLLGLIFFVPESPLWLIRKHQFDRARGVIRKIAITNGVDFDESNLQSDMTSLNQERSN